jgi:putative phage-type endonuclease
MTTKFLNVNQGTAEWLEIRRGRITASRMADVVTELKRGGTSAGYRDYRLALVAERLTGQCEENYVSPYMDWGTEYEPMARAAYEVAFDVMVDRIGFAIHPEMDFAGASPDALVGTDGVLEIKAPKTTTHLAWRLAGAVPEEYVPQMLWEMECCERKWCDFVSFDPRLPDGIRLFCVRLDYNPELAATYRTKVTALNGEVEEMIAKLGGRSEFKEQLRQSVAIDPEMMITDADLPAWAREMRETL